jgi:thiol-disulfide isomerase/thioredoxin
MASQKRTRRIAAAVLAIAALTGAVYFALEAAPERGVVVTAKVTDAEDPANAAAFDAAFKGGVEALRRGDAHAAMLAFKEAARLRPASSQAHVNLGFALVEMQSFDEALDEFSLALENNSGQFNAYYGIAEALEGKGELGQAAGAMKTYLYFAPASDPFRRRAEAALWEWGADYDALADSGADGLAADFSGSVHDLSAYDLKGGEVSFKDYEGKVLVLNIWASWCPPCRRELPALEALSKRLDAGRFAVVGVSVDENPEYVAEYLSRLGVDFRNLWDENRRLSDEVFNLDAYPTTFLVSASGEVEKKIVGYREWDSKAMIDEIKAVR